MSRGTQRLELQQKLERLNQRIDALHDLEGMNPVGQEELQTRMKERDALIEELRALEEK